MAKLESVWCPECDHEHECPVVCGEWEGDDDVEIPDECEACGEPLVVGGPPSYREDFHADG
jgi:hypothetical protein